MSEEWDMEAVLLRDFTEAPGGRYRRDGSCSAEEWRDAVLLPAAHEAMRRNASLTVILDGVAGVPVSFCEEAFGGLARELGPGRPWLFVLSDEDPQAASDAMRFYAAEATGAP